MGYGDRAPLAHSATAHHEWQCGLRRDGRVYAAAGYHRRNCGSRIGRGAVVWVWTTRRAGHRRRGSRRHAGGLRARCHGSRESPVDGQRCRESGSDALGSRLRGPHRVSRRWDVVVAGAGPAGSATALLLSRAGVRVLLLDRAHFPREKPCSEYLSPESTRVLERLGNDVLAAVAAASPAQLTGMKVVAPSGTGVVGRFETFSFALPRTRFDTILRAAAEAAGAEVREGVKVEELVYDGGAVGGVVTRDTGLGTQDTYRSRIVVGADGLRSVVARRLGRVRTIGPRRIAFTAHVADVAGVHDLGEMHVGRPGYVGLGPIGGGVTTVALVVPQPEAWRGAKFFDELNRFPGVAGRFDARRTVRPLMATGPFARWSRRAVTDGALLVGDAADFFDPFTGQGIYS